MDEKAAKANREMFESLQRQLAEAEARLLRVEAAIVGRRTVPTAAIRQALRRDLPAN